MILEQIKEIMVLNDITYEELTKSTKFIEDLGLDSLDFAKLVSSLEKKYFIKINDYQFGEIITIGDLINYIEDSIAVKSRIE